MWIILFILIVTCGIIIIYKMYEAERNIKIEKICDTQLYVRFKNLLQDCTLINKEFPIINFEIKQSGANGFFKFSIRFRDLGMRVISPQKLGLESAERQVIAYYQSELECLRNEDLLKAVATATDKAHALRVNIQQDFDSCFFNNLFDAHSLPMRNFVIISPFESYASSGGKYIIDTDYWQIEEENAIYKGILQFANGKNEIIPYAIEKTVKELFPNAKIIRYNDGCYISNMQID